MVLATQNPVETEGTYPLPEAQLDRFLLKVEIGRCRARKRSRSWCGAPRGVQATTCRSHTSNHASPGKMLRTFNSALRTTR